MIVFIYRTLNKMVKIFEKEFEKFNCKPSEQGQLLFFMFRSSLDISPAVILPPRLDDSISVRTGCFKLFKMSRSFISVSLLSYAYKFE